MVAELTLSYIVGMVAELTSSYILGMVAELTSSYIVGMVAELTSSFLLITWKGKRKRRRSTRPGFRINFNSKIYVFLRYIEQIHVPTMLYNVSSPPYNNTIPPPSHLFSLKAPRKVLTHPTYQS